MSQTEKSYLASYNIHDFDVPLCTVDMSIFTVINGQLQVLLVKRANFPKKGQWALPGGFIDLQRDRSIEDTAFRKLKEKTGVESPYLEQVKTIGNPTRDPRGWSITVLYFALISSDGIELVSDSSSSEVEWVPFKEAIKKRLAFDHKSLIENCYDRLRSKTLYTSLPIHLLPESFTLPQLQKTFEILLDTPVQKRSFRKRVLDADILEETGEMDPGVSRPAMLYRLKEKNKLHTFPGMLKSETGKD